jgi:hypothetical protein
MDLLKPRKEQMSDTHRTGTILIRKGTLLPPNLKIESEPFITAWIALTKLDGYGLGRKMKEANWDISYLAGAVNVIVLGRDGDMAVRRAVKRVLAKLKGKKFNSLEITKVVAKRFLGVPYVRVFAHSRNIQESKYPVAERAVDLKKHTPAGRNLEPEAAKSRPWEKLSPSSV